MGKILDEIKEVEYITVSELYELSEDEDNLLEVWEMDDKYCEIAKEAYDEQYNFVLRSEPTIIWEDVLSIPKSLIVDKEKVRTLLENLNPALFMTIPKIFFVSSNSELNNLKAFAEDNEQWEEDSTDWLYDYIEQFVIINIEDYEKTTNNKEELNETLVKALFSGIIDGFQSNPLYNSDFEPENLEVEKKELLQEIQTEMNPNILK